MRAWSQAYRDRRVDRCRRPHAGVRLRARDRQRAAGDRGARDRLPGRRRQRLRDLDAPSTTTTGRRSTSSTRTAASATVTSARALRGIRARDPAAAPESTARRELVSVAGDGVEAEADWEHLRSPETYLGYGRAAGLPSAPRNDEPARYACPIAAANEWALAGEWTIGREQRAGRAGGSIAFRFHARDAHLVLAPGRHGRFPSACSSTANLRAQLTASTSTRRPGNADPATAPSAGARARVDHGPHVRDRVPRCRRRGVRLHLRLATGAASAVPGHIFSTTVSTSADSASRAWALAHSESLRDRPSRHRRRPGRQGVGPPGRVRRHSWGPTLRVEPRA